ncbi:MAG: hypothetical protein LUI05_05590 [Oscillospiraceae bacterium]|nr:hypothetical protein [Oscillospiraceae bacterium]
MADKRYSIDDILNEYPKSEKSGSSSVSIDELLQGYNDGGTAYGKTADSETAGGSAAESKTASGGSPTPVPEADEKTEFERKYEKISGGAAARSEQPKEYKRSESAGRSFSEKIEQGTNYPEDNVKETLSERFRRLKKGEQSGETPNDEAPAEPSSAVRVKKADNPFDKYDDIAKDVPDEEENRGYRSDEAVKGGKSLDDILAEYADAKPRNVKKGFTQHKSVTEFFTRKLPSDRDEGNTELIDGMMRIKKERASRTQHISPAVRKSISDIDLNLDGKIMEDTSQISSYESGEAAKLNELQERRSKKIKDFVLVGDEEDEPEEEVADESSSGVIEDFEAFEDAPSIAADIAQLKNSLVIRMIVLLCCLAASAYISLANDLDAFPIIDILNKRTQTVTYLFVCAIIGLLAVFSSYTVISCGFSKLLSLKADCDSLSALSVVTSLAGCIIDIIMLSSTTNLVKGGLVHVYITSAICSLVFNTAGKLLIVSRTGRSFKFVSGSEEKYALFNVEDEEKAQSFTRGALRDFPRLASMRKTEFITEFLRTSYSSDSTDKFCRLFTPIIVGAAVIVAVLAGITARSEYGASGFYVGLSAFTGCISLCSAFSMMLVVNLPMEKSSKKNAELQGAVLGYDCIEEFADTNSVLVDAAQLFPLGSVVLSAIKVFSDTRIDEAIVEAASLTSQSGSILKNMFYDIIAGKTELLNPVESYIYEDSMGLCGWINNKRVLLGSRELMINHSIEGVPSAAKEQEYTKNGKSAVYLSISGELSALFVVELVPSIEIKQALAELQKQEIYTAVRTVDSLVSINRLSELFDVSPEFFKLLPFRVHDDYEEAVSYCPKQKAYLACSGKFAAFASLISSCRNLRGTISTGIAIEAVSILLGILICIAMVLLKSFSELNAAVTVVYNLIFAAVLVLFQTFRKN